ncbi:MAG: hydrogenase assembly protein HupF [Elusimicrobia bacterium RIFCSPLOWO2_01_FULL_64_13]|nr:MAG: hydrogenase assembly protein HupF [Elusimicrobia bacterium RIFCSPHIGHO2_01_FULL_64_10]OGR97767.1 MAG: hydrogenase assembly protein HupF [Elusimicrobia bacterium RIFCSPLOWO2_01_FULL_64_13]
MCLAVPGKVLSVRGGDHSRTGRVSFAGAVKEVNLSLTPEAREGDYVLVHVGFSISVVNETEAGRVFDFLREMEAREE